MRVFFIVLMLAASMPATAGFFDTDDCDRHREALKIGESLRLSVSDNDIDQNGFISGLGASSSVHTFVVNSEYQWGSADKLQVNGEQIKTLKKMLSQRTSAGFYVRLVQLDKSKTGGGCLVAANFDKFDEGSEIWISLTNQKNQCRLDLEAIPEDAGGLNKLKVLAARCPEYDRTSNSNVFFQCGELGRCEEHAEAAIEKLHRLKAAEQSQVKKEMDSRRSELLAGTVKIQSLQDAELVYQSDDLESITRSPLFEPDNKIYVNKAYYITLDAKEKSNLLRGKIIFGESSYGEVDFKYVYLRTNTKTVIFNPEKLRIGATINVIGKYVDNVTYTTLVGAEKLAPVLDVMFIE